MPSHNVESTYGAVGPATVHDGQSHQGHGADPHQEVTDGQAHDQHRRHRVESFGRSHDGNDKRVAYRDTVAQKWVQGQHGFS